MLEFLGFGLVRPFRQDGRADFLAAGGEQVLRSAVGQILGTVGTSDGTSGEVPWRTDFGSLIYRLRHQRNDSVLQELGRVYVVDALKRWEPRIVVKAVQISRQQHAAQNVLAVCVRYDVAATNSLTNKIILADIEQDILI